MAGRLLIDLSDQNKRKVHNTMDWINNAGKLAGSISAVIALLTLVLFKPIKNAIKKRREDRDMQKKFQQLVLEKLDAITDDIADLQYERLSQAHDFYTSQGWCPTSKKEQLCHMYKSYHNKGRNHLSEHYEQDILRLKDRPCKTGQN